MSSAPASTTATDLPPEAGRSVPNRRGGTGTVATRILGGATLVMTGWTIAFGLGFSPADRDMGESVRLLYIHVPAAWTSYLSLSITALCSALYLFGKHHSLGFDRFAGASAEIGTVFLGLALFTGSVWGKMTWGVFWAWDARLTTTALMFITFLGYLAVRNLGGSHRDRARRSAIIGLLAVVEIPIVHWSVRLWRSLHQDPSVLDPEGDVSIEGIMLFSLFVSVIAFTLLYVWLLLHRSRSLALEDINDNERLERALTARQAESVQPVGASVGEVKGDSMAESMADSMGEDA